MTRTSESHPLRIAAVTPGGGHGRIGITFCPGKADPDGMTGSWARDLDTDLDVVQRWGATAVVSLITDEELDRLSVRGLPDAVRDRHMEWWHAPIPDGWPPGPDFEDAWEVAGPAIRDRLRLGFDVLVHCKGGLGRAGTIAARLLVELGASPDDAIRRVRDARSRYAIETASQEAHVAECSVRAPSVPPQAAADIRDRALGAFLGLAIGDAVGTTLEFCSRDTQPRVVDMTGGGPFALPPGAWTDDTAMALALADSLAATGTLDCRDLMDRFVKWWRDGEYSCTGTCFDIGNATHEALDRYMRTGDPLAGSTDPQTAGNGSLMRLAPVSLRLWNDRSRLIDTAADQSRTTHGAEEAVDACRAFAELLADAIAGSPRSTVLAPRPFEGAPAIAGIMAGSWRGRPRSEIRSSGYVVHTLEAALWSVARTGDFRSAVLLAANLADDADTVAAVTGQLAGALYGLSGIPAHWLDRLAWKDRLLEAAQRLLEQDRNREQNKTETDIPRRSVGAVTILVPDYQEAIDYFVGTLGFTLMEDTRLSEEKRWVMVSPGAGTCLLLAKAKGERQISAIGNQSGGRVFLFLTTDNFRRDYRTYVNRGVKFQQEPRHEEYGMVAVFVDKYGNRWDLIESLPARGAHRGSSRAL